MCRRGIGLSEKVRAYALQDKESLDTIDANIVLGHQPDIRSFDQAGVKNV